MTLQAVECPLCAQSSAFLPVRIPSRDPHLPSYGALYAGRTQSAWKICGACGFVHQNPRPSIAALNAYYLQANYHEPLTETAEGHLRFARWYYSEKVDYSIGCGGCTRGRVLDIGC